MNERAQVRTPARPAHVETSVAVAAAEVGAEHPYHGFRALLEELGAPLAEVHDRCHEVDDAAWAAYTARLDRGLDELQAELSRAVEVPADYRVAAGSGDGASRAGVERAMAELRGTAR